MTLNLKLSSNLFERIVSSLLPKVLVALAQHGPVDLSDIIAHLTEDKTGFV